MHSAYRECYLSSFSIRLTRKKKHKKIGNCIARTLRPQKKYINRLVDAYQRPDSTVLISVRTYLSRDAAKPTLLWWLRSGGASSRSDQSRCPLNVLVLVYPECAQQRLVRPTNEALWVRSLVWVFSRCKYHFLKFYNCTNISQAVVELLMICLWSGRSGFNCLTSVAPAFQRVLVLFRLSDESWFICSLFWIIDE